MPVRSTAEDPESNSAASEAAFLVRCFRSILHLSDLTHSVVDRSACEFSLACKAGMFYDYERSPQLSESSSVTDQ